MRAVILSLDTGAYKAKADVAAAASLKRMLEQVGIEVRAAKAFPEDKEMLKTVLCKLADAGMVELVLTTGAVGFLEKHCAPDAVRETADRLLPGIPEALRAYAIGWVYKGTGKFPGCFKRRAEIRNRFCL